MTVRVDLTDIRFGEDDVHRFGTRDHDLTVLLLIVPLEGLRAREAFFPVCDLGPNTSVTSFRGSLAVGVAVMFGLKANERAGCVDGYRRVAGHLNNRHLARRLAFARDQNVVDPAR